MCFSISISVCVFFNSQKTLCSYSARLRRMVKQEKRRRSNGTPEIKITDFPGGPQGFELVSRFCYNNGKVPLSPSNICILHCSALLLEMTDDVSPSNLLTQAEIFLDGLFYWTWDDILTSLTTCEPFFHIADSSGLLTKLISSLLAKISENSSDLLFPASVNNSSSPCYSSSASSTPDSIKQCLTKEWWFDDLTVLAPRIIEKMLRTLGAYGADNKNLILTRFLLHYLKKVKRGYRSECGNLADTAVYGAVRGPFSCKGLFWVLRIVSGLGLSKECGEKLERMIGLVMDLASLDDLLVSGRGIEGVYDVSLVMRLVRVFVSEAEKQGEVPLFRMKKVGKLIDKYLGEISPDHSLQVSKFLAMAESLPDAARDCFDGVYRALDIYLESHPGLSSEDRSRLCRCLNYEKLTLEACKDLAKNPRIPPGAAIQAMVCQQSKLCKASPSSNSSERSIKAYSKRFAKSSIDEADAVISSPGPMDEKEELKVNLQKMQNRVMELEKVCVEMKGQMERMVRGRTIVTRSSSRGMIKLC